MVIEGATYSPASSWSLKPLRRKERVAFSCFWNSLTEA